MVKVIWGKLALKQLNKAYNHIKKDSLQAAKKVRDEIIEITENLPNNPEIYPLDKYRKNNNGSIRFFEKYRYRVAYQIKKESIKILRVRHTSREPLDF